MIVNNHTIDTLTKTAKVWAGCALTIGNFDGVHLGHQEILRQVKESSQRLEVPTVLLTFEPHPVRFFKPDTTPFRLSTPIQKGLLLKHYGIDYPLVLIFDTSLSDLKPREFVRRIVVEALQPSSVHIGYDFNFGKGRKGTPDLFVEYCKELDVDVVVQTAIRYEEDIVSSTRIRKAIREGTLDLVRRLLGRPYNLLGRVVHGDGRGRHLGFPTANLATETALVPPNGVYASYLEFDGRLAVSITNIGVRPTFGGTEREIETFVLDAESGDELDLYGRPVSLHLISRLREERRFDSPKALLAQISLDIETCRALLREDHGRDIIPQAEAVEDDPHV